MEKLQKITFIALLEKLSKEQVATWWKSVTPDNVSKEAKKTNWKYFLQKNDKRIEFKWALYDLAKHYGYIFTTFNSDKGSRNAICERFGFEIYEKLVYDNSEKKSFLKLYNNKIKLKPVFQDFINYAADIVTNKNFDAYKTRMAIDTKNEALFIIGMRTVLSYREKDNKAIIGFVVSDDFANTTKLEKRYQYKGEPQQSYLEYTVSNWQELPENLLSENTIEIQKKYNSVKETKRSTWNSEANTTNSVLKYLMFKKINVEEWLIENITIEKEYLNLKNEFADWLVTKSKANYFNRNKNKTIQFLERYNELFDFDLYKTSRNEYLKHYNRIKVIIYNNDTSTDFFAFSKKDSNHRIKAILGKDNYFKFLTSFFKNEFNTTLNNTIDMKQIKHPLNQILYGPPGTGKTYNTINKAIAIANPDFDLSQERSIIKEEYDRLIENGQILFTTFHQSMSYEDFVEGIKPKTIDEKDVVYNVEDGIFKQICEKAQEKETVNFLDAYYKMISDFRECDNEILDLKTPNGNVFSVNANSNDNLQLYTTANRNEQGSLTKERLEAFYKGDESVFLGWQSYANGVIKHLEDNYGLRKSAIQTNLNYVLIIDEINRGNVSAIFGELITLIEEDKRLGNDEALTITLPYSKKTFGVPKNLYIIGTMNTADRSVEALDTALRRRFNFKEMMPEYDLKELETVLTVDLKTTLEAINKRIEILLDREHQIGHSYFLNIQTEADLLNAFQNKIIPLLQEYFYNDYDKIGLVLGDKFIEKNKHRDNTIFSNYTLENKVDYLQDTFSWVDLDTSTIIDAVNSISGTENND